MSFKCTFSQEILFSYFVSSDHKVHTCAIKTRCLYTFYPLFEVHLCTVTFGLMYGQYSRAVSNQEWVIVVRVQYTLFYLRNGMIIFFNFFIFQWLVIEAENVFWHKIKPAWKMSGGGKSCSQGQECLWVENSLQPKMSLQKMPRSGKYLKVANVWRSKKLQPVSKSEQTHRLDSNQFNCYNSIFHQKRPE